MIRVDYSGLDWKKIGYRANNRIHKNCGGEIWYCKKHDAMFCNMCGNWLVNISKDKNREHRSTRPRNAIQVLNKVTTIKIVDRV